MFLCKHGEVDDRPQEARGRYWWSGFSLEWLYCFGQLSFAALDCLIKCRGVENNRGRNIAVRSEQPAEAQRPQVVVGQWALRAGSGLGAKAQ